MKKAEPQYSITELCRLFDISMSSYYYHLVTASQGDIALMTLIKSISVDSGNTYGKRRINIELRELGKVIGLHKTRTLMKHLNIKAIRPKKNHYYPDAGSEHKYAPNLLKRQFTPSSLNTHWVGDITYIRTHQGWSYLACVLDLSSREIVGYSLSTAPNAQLAKEALDNAVMERFFRSLKTERLNSLSFISHQSVVSEVHSYIQFYNYKRRHSVIDYMTPHQKSYELKNVA